MSSLKRRLGDLDASQPASWAETGVNARPNLHGLLRYPAMMVPRMQGDIIDAITGATGAGCRVVDPFVGSGTVMTESLIRGLDFTGVDINPLAVLVCEAKAAIDRGANIERAAQVVIQACRFDILDRVDVDFPGLSKWFDLPVAACLSRLRRSIMQVADIGARKVMWTVFAETIRLGSNSRTSTYKLHIRPVGDRVDAQRIVSTFENAMRETLARVAEYRDALARRAAKQPDVRLICGDVRHADLDVGSDVHSVIVTSPPYGDNQTTIPYGQFSYLALRWIPTEDLPRASTMPANTHALDTASLGGSMRTARAKVGRVTGSLPSLDGLITSATAAGAGRGLLKVGNFVADLFEAFSQVRTSCPGEAHWVLTVGNRTAHGIQVPFDDICTDMLRCLGGKPVASLRRSLPNKRMPRRNGLGALINTETTLVMEFT